MAEVIVIRTAREPLDPPSQSKLKTFTSRCSWQLTARSRTITKTTSARIPIEEPN